MSTTKRFKLTPEERRANELATGTSGIHRNLEELWDYANDACAAAIRKHGAGALDAAANWADLSCVNVEYTIDASNEPGYTAYFEEASDCDDELHDYLVDYLADCGYPRVAVKLEW